MDPLYFRRASASESEALSRLAFAAKASWGYSAELLAAWRDDLTVTPEFIESHYVVCACVGDEVVGFAGACGGGDEYELEHLWVLPEAMRLGVGRALMGEIRRHLARTGASRLRVVSDPNALGFYERIGAKRVGDVDSVPPGRRLPLLVMDLETPDEDR